MAAQAFETRLNGFISVGAGMTLQEDQKYITDPANFNSQFVNELSIKPDTMVAIQSMSTVNDRLSATAQLTGYATSDFGVKFEWAYVNYELFNDVDLKFGRIRMPIYNYSSSLDLGYSYVWIRPPVDLYNVFLTSLEGISADYEFSLGNWYGTATGYFGETDGVDPETSSEVVFDSILGGIVQLENGSFSLRGSYSHDDDITITRQDSSQFNMPIAFSSASALYDNGSLLLNAEYTLTQFLENEDGVKLNNNEAAWYATAGYRVGSFTPHFTLSSFKQLGTSSVEYGPVSAKDYLQDVSSWTAGVRWDFDIAAALKVEYTSRTDNSEYLPSAVQQLVNPSFIQPFTDAQVISVAVDVVF
ncbi:hypothetical protein MED297_01830 [Reinekea sp. MED297]|uniref:Porin domain-containing protein n=2 Tax=Reinekea TaxID=230494 RepID=A4BC36_9GAMM|nr:hypothetical protein MED297_01830 [Reinekea sp. MED297] [Reinekea blandensis MED297]